MMTDIYWLWKLHSTFWASHFMSSPFDHPKHLIMKSTKASLLVILANNNMKNTIHFTITSVLFVFRINCVFYHLIPCAIASNFPKTVSGNLYQRKCIRTYYKKVNRCKSIQVHACNIWYTHMNFKKISWT